MSKLVCLQIFICLTVQIALAQQSNRQSSLDSALINLLSEDNAADSSPERVDKLASAGGDSYWRLIPQHQQQRPDWLYQQTAPRFQRSLNENGEPFNNDNSYQRLVGPSFSDVGYQSSGPVGLDGPASSRNYHSLVDEFRQYSRMANPSRESRAFKPKLMSTARGFGKRSQIKPQSDLFVASGPMGKSAGSEESTKYADWINQIISKWRTLDKFVNSKYADYNGKIEY